MSLRCRPAFSRAALFCSALFGVALPATAHACETALLLSMDVSGSIDRDEYRLQVDGLSAALLDPVVVDALVQGRDRLAVAQWSGAGQMTLSLPWTAINSHADAARFAARVQAMPRAYLGSDTAVGEAITFAVAQFADVADCERHVADLSGDGPLNAGRPTAAARRSAELQGITLNGLAIDGFGRTVTNFYLRHVITRDGFVVTAQGFLDYARAIRLKLIRELTRPIG
ncbi:DUF1194 domain-containing protein [Thioclava sp. BHET1]|nr:DUF1194 domain-containing protein [Thioclava sp. BHET1]